MNWRRGAFGFLGASSFLWTETVSPRRRPAPLESPRMHLRQPSIDRGVTSFLWAFGLGLYIWLGMLAVGVEGATAFIMSVLAACVIFLVVRLYGGDRVRKPPQSPKARTGSR
jgi:hypothetical protein